MRWRQPSTAAGWGVSTASRAGWNVPRCRFTRCASHTPAWTVPPPAHPPARPGGQTDDRVASRAMRLLPREQERLLLFLAAELARKRRARGLRAQPGRGDGDRRRRGLRGRARRRLLRRGRGAPATPRWRGRRARRAWPRWSRASRSRRCSPTAAACRAARPDRRSDGPPAPRGEPTPPWLDGDRPLERRQRGRGADRRDLALPLLRGQPRAALRPRGGVGHAARACRPGTKVFFAPGEPRAVHAHPDRRRARRPRPRRAGRRPARRARRARAWRSRSRASGATAVPDLRVALGDSGARRLVAEADDVGGPDRILPAWATRCATASACAPSAAASSSRSSAACCSTRCSASATTSIGVANGRVVAIGRAGNPDTMDGVDVVLDTATAVIDATGLDRHAGRHRHARALALAAGLRRGAGRRADDARDPGLRPGLEPRLQPARGGRRPRGRRSRRTRSTPRCSCARPRRGPSRSSTRCAPAARG